MYMKKKLIKTENVCDSNGEIVYIVISRPVYPSHVGYFIDPRSTRSVRIYGHKTLPPRIYMVYRSFKNAVELVRSYVRDEETFLDN